MASPFLFYLPSPSISNYVWFLCYSLKKNGFYLLVSILPTGGYSICQTLQNIFTCLRMFPAKLAEVAAMNSEGLHILDCNGGDHGQHFATNFNPEINIREITAPARHWENGAFVETPALAKKVEFDFEAVGPKKWSIPESCGTPNRPVRVG